MAVFFLAAACSSDDRPPGTIGYVEGFLGGVVADEPFAATVGRNVLSAGGTAADAAVATYFALSVTMPSAASLGGGGVCVVFDSDSLKTEALDFLARAPRSVPASATRPSAVPGNPRGFFALHAKYGGLRWETLITPAEHRARFGVPVSRAFSAELATLGDALMAEPDMRRLFARPDGGALREGDVMSQIELAAVLSRLRREGPGDLYAGGLTTRFVEGVRAAGGSLTAADLRDYQPQWRETIAIPFGNEVAHFAPPPAAAGGVAAQMWAMLLDNDRYADADPQTRRHLLAETAMRAFADRGAWLAADGTAAVPSADLVAEERIERLLAGFDAARHTPADSLARPPVAHLENPAATSFVTFDSEGSAVACTLTMNGLFGTGRVAEGTGVILASVPGPGGRGPTSLGPMVVVNENVGNLYLAAAASGGAVAPTAMVAVAAEAMLGETALDSAMAAKRVHHQGHPDILFHEAEMDEAVLQNLVGRGYRLAPTPMLGRVNAVYCPEGAPVRFKSCKALADMAPRGYGLAAMGEQ